MRRTYILCFLLLQIGVIQAQKYEFTSAKITFEFPSKGVKGSIEGFESQSQVDLEVPSNSIFKGSVEVASLDTNNGLRNWSLRSSRYFNAKEHPKLFYSSNEVRKIGANWLVDGDLTIKGNTNPVQITFEEVKGKFVGSARLYASDFGIKIKKNREDNLVNIVFELELVR